MSKLSEKVETPDVVIGKPIDRVDGRLKVTGGAKYAVEFAVSKPAYAVLVQSTIAKGKVTHFDESEATKAPGVLAVMSSTNLPEMPKPQAPGGRHALELFDREIFFSGQNIGAVVAETLEQALYAASLIRVEYEFEQPATSLDALLGSAIGLGGNPRAKSGRGDVDAALAAASVKIEATYRTPIEHHNPMEPHASIAVWDGDRLTAYDSTQGVSGCAQNLSRKLGVKRENVRVVDPFVGGGFGCKGMPWPHTVIAAAAAKMVGRPVKLALTRREMFSSNGHRPQTMQALTLGATADGRLTAIRHEMHGHTSELDMFLEGTGGPSNMLYSCPNVSVSYKLVRLNVGSPTYMRAPGEATGSFSIESAMDELAVALKMDPIELRLKNYAETDESSGRPWSSKSLRECYAQGAKAFGWSTRTKKNSTGALVGFGMATATYPANYWGASARARMAADGSVLIQCGTQDLGTGTYTILTQIAAETLGVPVHSVRVEIGDSSLPPAPGSGGSTSATSAGSAVLEASQALRKSLLALGNFGDSNLIVRDGVVSPSGEPASAISYRDLLKRAGKTSLEEEVTADRPRGEEHSGYGFGAQFCEVHVDPDLGSVRVARWVGAFGLGKVLNMKTLQSQLRGGIIFGIGMGLMEASILDPEYGRFVGSNLVDYHLPVHLDVPPIDIHLIEEEDPYVSPLGAKGAGEIGITGVAAALANAVFDATGKRIRELPITLDKLL